MALLAGTAERGRVTPALLRALSARGTVTAPRPPLSERIPFTDEPLGEVPHATAEDVVTAVERARAAAAGGARAPNRARAQVLLRFHDLLLDRHEELLDIVQLETGKARRHAFE